MMKLIFCILVLACYASYVLALSEDCEKTTDCPRGQACVSFDGTLKCCKFAKKGEKCSQHTKGIREVDVYKNYPPCYPQHHLRCKDQDNSYMCVKQE